MRKFSASRLTRSVFIIAVAMAGASYANAGLIQVRDQAGGTPPAYFIDGTYGVPTCMIDGVAFDIQHTGTLGLEMNAGSGWAPLPTYCTEVTVGIGFDVNPPDAVGLAFNDVAVTSDARITAGEQHVLEVLWANAHADSMTSDIKAGAFQVIVWELATDDVADFGDGLFRLDGSDAFTAGILAQANQWLGNIADNTWTAAQPLRLLQSDASQDFLRPVPEPASIGLVAVGTLVLALRRRFSR